MNIQDEDSPNIGLKISFDKINPELYTLMYLLSILLITTFVFLILHIIDFVVNKSIQIYNYVYQNDKQDVANYDQLFN
jgi:hypothetical protein